MITRLVPVFPYNLQNFAYGVTDIKFSAYSIASLLFMLPGTAMYTVGAAGIADRENRSLYIGIAILLAMIVMCVGAYLKKHYVKGNSENSERVEAENESEQADCFIKQSTEEVERNSIHSHKCMKHCTY